MPAAECGIAQYGSLVAAFATFLAVLAALFREEVRRWWNRPDLTARIQLRAPDCHKIPLEVRNPQSGPVLASGDSYYFRLWVEKGSYQLILQIAAANSRPVEKRLQIDLTGKWFPDEQAMFKDGIEITELS
ncbi:MAG: hypothetical protein ACREIJ_01250 [Nitrospiraceae bacterium]